MKGTILYLGNFELPDKGAAANRVVSNGKIFRKLGYRTVFLGVKKGTRFSGIQQTSFDENMYEEAYPAGSKEWLIHMVSVKNIEALLKLYDDVRMIILYNVPYTLLWSVKNKLKHTGIKVVYDCTEWTGVTDGSAIKKLVKRVDETFIRNRIDKLADGLLVISKRMEAQYQGCQHLLRLPPLVDVHDKIWHQERLKSENFVFCFAGMLDGNKESLDCIVDAFGKLKSDQAILRIIGVTKEEFADFYPNGKELLEAAGKNVEFQGRKTHEETIREVLSCDCYIFIRQSDLRNNAGFPTKFSESYTCGVPMITTDISDIKKYLENKKDSTVLSGTSVSDVRIAMEKAMKNKHPEARSLDQTFHYETYVEACEGWMKGILG